jgi:hypothetical protein
MLSIQRSLPSMLLYASEQHAPSAGRPRASKIWPAGFTPASAGTRVLSLGGAQHGALRALAPPWSECSIQVTFDAYVRSTRMGRN